MTMKPGRERPSGDLDPMKEPGRWEGLVARIGARAAPHLAERRAPPGVLDVVARWARPALATAASLLLLAAAGGLWLMDSGPDSTEPSLQIALAVMPPTFAGWINGTAEPSVSELVRELDTMDQADR